MRMIQGKVLFVGNDADLSTLLVRILNRSGCQAMAASQQEVLRTLTKQDFDCILLDWVMDEDRDQKFCHQIRLLAPRTSVFLFTGVSSSQEIMLSLQDLPDEKLSPINLDTLVADVFHDDWKGSEMTKTPVIRGM